MYYSRRMRAIKPKIAFFGTPEFSVKILEAMKNAGFLPGLIITSPDKPKGRGRQLSPSPVKVWAEKNNLEILQPTKLNELQITNNELQNADLFVAASYGKILPKEILEIPKYGALNVHPSLLPKLRGPSPIQTAILNNEEKTGVTIMLMNEKMDEGPILAQRELEYLISNSQFLNLEEQLAKLGGKLLIETIPKWLKSEIKPTPQNHSRATYSKLIAKKDGEINRDEPAEIIERKIRAFTPWPGAYTFYNGKRIIITKAELKNDALVIKRVKPEGKNEMEFSEFLKNNPGFSKIITSFG